MMKYSGREERETSTLNFDNFPMVLFLACMCARCLDSSDGGLYIYHCCNDMEMNVSIGHNCTCTCR